MRPYSSSLPKACPDDAGMSSLDNDARIAGQAIRLSRAYALDRPPSRSIAKRKCRRGSRAAKLRQRKATYVCRSGKTRTASRLK
jgi:hypothetical protein